MPQNRDILMTTTIFLHTLLFFYNFRCVCQQNVVYKIFTKIIEAVIFVCVCLCPLLFLSGGRRTRGLGSEYKIDQADFTDCMHFLASNLVVEISLILRP